MKNNTAAAAERGKDTFELIAHSAIAPSPDNPRRTFGEADLAELADSIRFAGGRTA